MHLRSIDTQVSLIFVTNMAQYAARGHKELVIVQPSSQLSFVFPSLEAGEILKNQGSCTVELDLISAP